MRTFITLSFVFSCLLMVQAQAKAASICDAAAGNLVANCGFESGDFTSWTLSGNDVPGEEGNLYGVEGVDPIDSIAPNSGNFQAYFADLVANSTTLSQTIATNPGDTYAISFYLAQDTDPASGGPGYGNAITASFDGNTLIDATDIPVEGYTEYSYTEMASDPSSALDLVLGNDLGEFLVDDVVVTDTSVVTPEPSAWLLMLAACAIAGIAGAGKFRRAEA
jgi:hypothetical protein